VSRTKVAQDSRQADAEIGITPAMIEAGVYSAREHCLGLPLERLVEAILLAALSELSFARQQ